MAKSLLGRCAIAMIVLLPCACGGGGGGGGAGPSLAVPTAPTADICGVDAQKDFVLDVAQDWYLWYDELASVDPADFSTAQEYLSALTAPLAEDFRDPGFSFLTTVAEDNASLGTGAFVGFGFRFGIDAEGRYLISDAYEDGTAFAAGFVRGAEIRAVDRGDGFVTMREYEEQGVTLEDIFGPSEEGVRRGFRLGIDDEILEVDIEKTELPVAPLALAPRRLERPGLSPVGYVHLRGFTATATSALVDVFADLARDDITDFIIDLRYNGGGLVSVAEDFLDLLGGSIADGEIAYRVRHNEKRSSEDNIVRFSPQSSSVAPLRIAFLTSAATASASETLINSIAPQVEVVLIGSDTLGKAVGQYGFDQRGCDTRMRLVAFEIVDGDGFGGFFTGLADTGRFTLCEVEDSFRGAFGTSDDPLTAGALGWLNDGVCGPVAASDTPSSARGLRRGPFPLAPPHLADRRSLWVQ
ncbi:MAG: S41 family peptidase [Pseudomonadota bacterium]